MTTTTKTTQNLDRYQFQAWYIKKKILMDLSQESSSLPELIQMQKDGIIILRQSTGLKDINGELIYEGDIVKHDIQSDNLEEEDWETITGEVVWYTDGFCVGEYWHPLCTVFENTILGNIYENPGLLD